MLVSLEGNAKYVLSIRVQSGCIRQGGSIKWLNKLDGKELLNTNESTGEVAFSRGLD